MTCTRDHVEGIERIVVIHDFATPEGGAGVLAIQAVQEYRRLGIPVTYFAGATDGACEGLERSGKLVGLHANRLLNTSPALAMMQGIPQPRRAQQSEALDRQPRYRKYRVSFAQLVADPLASHLRSAGRRRKPVGGHMP